VLAEQFLVITLRVLVAVQEDCVQQLAQLVAVEV
jgi:hypothetical protein